MISLDGLSLSISNRASVYINNSAFDDLATFIDECNQGRFIFPGKHFNLSPIDGNFIGNNYHEVKNTLLALNGLYALPTSERRYNGDIYNENMNTRMRLANWSREHSSNFLQYFRNCKKILDLVDSDYYRNNWQAVFYAEGF